MIFLRRSKHLPIGVDLGSGGVKLLQLEERQGSLAVIAKAYGAVTEAAPGETRISQAIAQMGDLIRRGEFRGRQIVLPLPREWVQVKTLRLPVLPEADLQATVRVEAESLFAVKADQLILRTLPAGEVRQGTESRLEVLVLAVEQKSIDQLLEQCNHQGLTVDSMEFEPCCLYRGIERFLRRRDDENEVNVLVDVGVRQSQVVIGRGREITFNKVIDIGGRTFSEMVSRKLGLTLEEASGLRRRFASLDASENDGVRQTVVDATRGAMADLAHEVSLCLRYYSVTFRGQRPARLRLMGGEANDLTLRQILGGSLSVPVEVFRPLQGLIGASTFFSSSESLGEWSAAFGAALRRVKHDVSRQLDSPEHRRKDDASIVEVVDVGSAVSRDEPIRVEAVGRTEGAILA
ncbi:MAG TPA: pilus assembly protein PilM [Tepidisphaeraceae bacterium]|jgi:type IV pilus assembly protein PilM